MADMEQMKFADAGDWCTVAYAAEKIDVSQRSVRRWIIEGTLKGYRVRHGSRETGRRHVILAVTEVEAYARARKLVRVVAPRG